MSAEFKSKLTIITGASKLNGIGFATAQLVLTYNSNEVAVQSVVDKIQALGVKVVTVQADAGSPTLGEDLIDTTVTAFPGHKIDIIVNNAGHATFQESPRVAPIEEFDALFHPNVRGPQLLITAALPPGGRIVNIGSMVARMGAKHRSLYSSTKAALNTLSLAWAEELGVWILR